MSTVILAGTNREADAYRMENGPRYANYNPTVAQVKSAETIIELPSFAERRDRFGLEAGKEYALRYGRDVQHELVEDWVYPKPVEETPAPEPEDETAFASLYELDLTDPDVLERLKVALNEVGLTLKKLPAKKQDAPVVDAPVEF